MVRHFMAEHEKEQNKKLQKDIRIILQNTQALSHTCTYCRFLTMVTFCFVVSTRGRYLLQLSTAHHRFQMMMRMRGDPPDLPPAGIRDDHRHRQQHLGNDDDDDGESNKQANE